MSTLPSATASVRAATVILTGLMILLTGCTSDPTGAASLEPGSIEPGPDAAAPACQALLGRLPDRVLDRERNDLDVPGVASWGEPGIVLRCGIEASGPTSDPCLEVGGLDWTFSETQETLQFVSFARTPVMEVRVSPSVGRENATAALIDLADAVRPIPATNSCT